MNVIGDLDGPQCPSYDISSVSVDKENIYRRNGGCGVVAEAKLYIWGGEGAEQRLLEADSDSEEDDFSKAGGIWAVTVLPPPRIEDHPFDVYDMHTCSWSRQKTSGDTPIFVGLGSSLNYHVETRTIYLFGGWNYGLFDADIYCIELDEWNWLKVKIMHHIKPIGRYLTGTLIHEWRLCTLGGTGLDIIQKPHTTPQDAGARYQQTYFKGEGFGLNNEYYEFDMKTRKWTVPLGEYSERPDPLSCHCFVKFDTYRAILFGGGYKDKKRNEMRIFDLEERIFTGPLVCSEPCPTGRAFATLSPLIDPLIVGQKIDEHGTRLRQRLLLLWGKQLNDVILTDVWILDIDEDHFSLVQFDINTYARAWAIAAPLYYKNSTDCRLAIFGGNVHWNGFVGKRRNIGDVRVALFGVSSLARMCAGVIAKTGRDASAYNLPHHSLAYRLIDRAIQTLHNASPTLTVTKHQYNN